MWQTAFSRPGGTASAIEKHTANAESAGTVAKRATRAKMKIRPVKLPSRVQRRRVSSGRL